MGPGKLNRVKPSAPPSAYQTWSILTPIEQGQDYWTPATCQQVDCKRWREGFQTRIDESTPLGKQQAQYLRADRTRKPTETRDPTGLTLFNYPPGTTCFRASEHRIRTGRPPIFLKRGGDWRAHLGGGMVYDRDDQWVSDFAEHQEHLARIRG